MDDLTQAQYEAMGTALKEITKILAALSGDEERRRVVKSLQVLYE